MTENSRASERAPNLRRSRFAPLQIRDKQRDENAIPSREQPQLFARHLMGWSRFSAVHVYKKEINPMKMKPSFHIFLFHGGILLGSVMVISGCQHRSFPDEKGAVTDSLKNNDLGSIDVWQDRDKGVITLKGNVASDDDKQRAENLVKQAAPQYTIADEIGVRPPDEKNAGSIASKQDSAIEDNFEAAIKSNQDLEDQTIHFLSKNRTLVITGSVKTPNQKAEVSNLARHVPDVQQVVNELDVKPDKHSTPNS
jgi:hyperosmotically inducible periplasmic protein